MNIVPEDNRFIREVLESQEYKYLFDYPVVVDAGANIGTFSMWIYDKAVNIYALEPIPEIFDYLKQNIKNNQLTKIKPYNLALGMGTGKRRMKSDPQLSIAGGGSQMLTGMIGGDVEVDCKQLAEFMSDEGINYVDLLKLDVEGSENEILENNFPKDKVGTIIGECHEHHSVKGILESMGYKYIDLGTHFLAR